MFRLLVPASHAQGPAQKALDFFAASGYPCPELENPANHFMDVITPNINDSVDSLVEKEAALKALYKPPAGEHRDHVSVARCATQRSLRCRPLLYACVPRFACGLAHNGQTEHVCAFVRRASHVTMILYRIPLNCATQYLMCPPAPALRAAVEHLMENPKPLLLPRDTTPWTTQFRVLLRRSLKEQWRKRNVTYVLMTLTTVMAVLVGTVFLRIGTSQTSVTRRSPVLFFTVINQVRAARGAIEGVNSSVGQAGRSGMCRK